MLGEGTYSEVVSGEERPVLEFLFSVVDSVHHVDVAVSLGDEEHEAVAVVDLLVLLHEDVLRSSQLHFQSLDHLADHCVVHFLTDVVGWTTMNFNTSTVRVAMGSMIVVPMLASLSRMAMSTLVPVTPMTSTMIIVANVLVEDDIDLKGFVEYLVLNLESE